MKQTTLLLWLALISGLSVWGQENNPFPPSGCSTCVECEEEPRDEETGIRSNCSSEPFYDYYPDENTPLQVVRVNLIFVQE